MWLSPDIEHVFYLGNVFNVVWGAREGFNMAIG